MTSPALGTGIPSPFASMNVDHVRFVVADTAAAAAPLVDGYGFTVVPVIDLQAADGEVRTTVLRQGDVELVLAEPLIKDHPYHAYLESHGDGVADIAIGVPDAAAAFAAAIARGARPLALPRCNVAGSVTATVAGFGDLAHTFVQRAAPPQPGPSGRIDAVDHFAICVEAGRLAEVVDFYQTTLDLGTIFSEQVRIGTQAIDCTVVQSRTGAVTFTLIAPDVAADPGHVDAFLRDHGGPGVQHVAFATADVVAAVGKFRGGGVEFLPTPPAYYRLLADRLLPARHSVAELSELGVLVDADHGGQLFQIFARSTHSRGTLFFEVIERCGAQLFGSGNIRALYEAVEAQQDVGIS